MISLGVARVVGDVIVASEEELIVGIGAVGTPPSR